MIVSTLIAASVATQTAPAQESKVSSEPAAEKKMACCEMMAKGNGCCCCKDEGAESHGKESAGQGSDDASEHAH